jgi:4-amino-4-deoxy-L-arabinose transferase-like glycosyltransferase
MACAFVPRLACGLLTGTRMDDIDEWEPALRLLSGQGLRFGAHDALLPPAFPITLAGFIKVFGPTWTPFHIAMALAGTAVCWMVYLIGRDLMPEMYARGAAFWLALYPPQVFWSTRANSRMIGAHLLVFIAWFICSRRDRSPARALAIGVLWGVLTLFRSEYSAGIILVAAFLFLTAGPFPRKVLLSSCFLIGFGLTVSPWLARNYRIFHRVVFSSNVGINLWHAFNPRYDFTGVIHDEATRNLIKGKSEMGVQDFYASQALAYIRSDPWRILPRTLGGNFLNFWRPYLSPDAVSWKENALYILSYAPVFIFFLVGLFKVPWKKEGWALTGALIAYQCLFHLPFYMIVHFREMVVPFMILVATAGVMAVAGHARSPVKQAGERTPTR